VEPQDGGRLATRRLGEQPIEVVEHLGRDLAERLAEEPCGELPHEPPVSVERGWGPADVLDVIEPRVEQLGDRALLGLDDARRRPR